MNTEKPLEKMTRTEAELLDLYKKLTPENKEYALLLLTFFACDPGFTEAYKSLPNAPGQNCPSKKDVKQLMHVRTLGAYKGGTAQ